MTIEDHIKEHGCFCYIGMAAYGYTRAKFDTELKAFKASHVVSSESFMCANKNGVEINYVVKPSARKLNAYKALLNQKTTKKKHTELSKTTPAEFAWLHGKVPA